ncbi:Required for respiratory growth protein 9 mitochondrial [Coemansia sp. RSA 486]|nr:Required for respiratory growth protein 9 mitochondrial [Coemansia sp. RSA 486]KAJ2225832.1 Required for respiratory growth protein 9 mitochondrial [Coemansia sp. RSA 485]KAJ2639248.1 Required for respiratory growth protein 9 mitochondrial [Coemansia sp. RSA 1286]
MSQRIIASCLLSQQLRSAYQQQCRRLSATASSSLASKTILHRLSEGQQKNESWLEQKLHSEKLTSHTDKNASPNSKNNNKSKSSNRNRDGYTRSDSGFVRIDKSDRSSHGKNSNAGKEGAATTLTEKALKAKLKWRESNTMKEKMQDRLKDGSLEGWKRRKIELKLKLGNDGWEPTKKIAVSSMEKIRLLNAEFPEVWTMKRLSEQFKVSQETIRRIIKSKYRPDADKIEKREQKRRTQMRSYKLQENAQSAGKAKDSQDL